MPCNKKMKLSAFGVDPCLSYFEECKQNADFLNMDKEVDNDIRLNVEEFVHKKRVNSIGLQDLNLYLDVCAEEEYLGRLDINKPIVRVGLGFQDWLGDALPGMKHFSFVWSCPVVDWIGDHECSVINVNGIKHHLISDGREHGNVHGYYIFANTHRDTGLSKKTSILRCGHEIKLTKNTAWRIEVGDVILMKNEDESYIVEGMFLQGKSSA